MSTPRKSRRSKTVASSATPPASSTTASPSKRSKSPSRTSHETEPNRKALRTPPRRSASAKSTGSDDARIVTPATSSALALEKKSVSKSTTTSATSNARRSLTMTSPVKSKEGYEHQESVGSSGKKLPFGGKAKPIEIPDNVQRVYHIVHKHTGSIGGNGSGGAIYGELTTGSMQKMTNLMIEHTGLSKDSRFIDVGCGLGKPNMHVASYPGVDFSYGIEMEHVRWMLAIANLHQVLGAAKKDCASGENVEEGKQIGHSCYFAHGDITEANFFDPFTHVYMFDIGFPPRLFHQLATMFNNSQSEYLICYHGPKLMIEDYGFNIELIVQTPTSMHGSAEGHTGYIYRRRTDCKRSSKTCKTKKFGVPCDPLFANGWETCRAGLDAIHKHTADEANKHMGRTKKRVTRSVTRKSSLAEEKKAD